MAGVAYALFIAAKQLWEAGVRVLAAFASFLVALVVTLPMILVAGCIALGGLWVINNVNFSSLPSFAAFKGDNTGKNIGDRQPDQTSGQGGGEATGSKP